MEPIAVWVRDDGESPLIHRCVRCGKVNANRIAGDDDEPSRNRPSACTTGWPAAFVLEEEVHLRDLARWATGR